MKRPLRVGLTGGVATGKSSVADAFARRGVPVLSADRIAHVLTAPGQPLLEDIRAAFGADIFDADGSLDRAALADRVFDDAGERRRLEAILHPPIRAALVAGAAAGDDGYCILEIPLLRAVDVGPLVDRVLVVDLPRDEQLRRLQARDGIDRTSAERRADAQPDRAVKLSLADDMFMNDGTAADIDPAVERLHAHYAAIARAGDFDRPGLRLP